MTDDDIQYDKKMIAMGILMPIVFVGIGLYILYELDTAIDYNVVHEQIMTNQTYVDNIDCDKIKETVNLLPFIWSPTQQDEINQLKIDFDMLYKDKTCDSSSSFKKDSVD